MSISTLKTVKVGDKVTMLTFTGMNLGQFEVTKAGKTKIAIVKKDGTQAEFSRETGLQTNADNPKYANKVVDLIPETEKKAPVKKVEKVVKTPEKAEKAEPVKKSTAAAKPTKKVEKVEIEDDAEDFEDEDLDDDFEEFEEE